MLLISHAFQERFGNHSRFLRSETYKKNMAANRIVVSEFGTVAHPNPCKTLFQRYYNFVQYTIHYIDP